MSVHLPRIALIEDNDDLREEMVFFLQSRGYAAWGASSAEDFWKRLHRNPVISVQSKGPCQGEENRRL